MPPPRQLYMQMFRDKALLEARDLVQGIRERQRLSCGAPIDPFRRRGEAGCWAQVFPLTGTFWPRPSPAPQAPEVGAGIIFNPLSLGPCCFVVFSCATSCIRRHFLYH